MITDNQARELKQQFYSKVDSSIYFVKSLFRAYKRDSGAVILPKQAQEKILQDLENLKK